MTDTVVEGIKEYIGKPWQNSVRRFTTPSDPSLLYLYERLSMDGKLRVILGRTAKSGWALPDTTVILGKDTTLEQAIESIEATQAGWTT